MQNWSRSRFQENQLDLSIHHVRMIAYGNQDNANTDSGRSPTNMWAIFLGIRERYSIRLEMVRDLTYESAIGDMTIESKKHFGSYNSVKSFDLAVTELLPARSYVDSIIAGGRDRFRFSNAGEGCRHWVHTVIADWEAEGFLVAGTHQKALDDVSYYYHASANVTDRVPRAVEQGTFF